MRVDDVTNLGTRWLLQTSHSAQVERVEEEDVREVGVARKAAAQVAETGVGLAAQAAWAAVECPVVVVVASEAAAGAVAEAMGGGC